MFGSILFATAMASAAAQPIPLPERLRASPSKQQQEEARKVMMNFAKCMADSEPELARAYVLSDNDDADAPEFDGLVDDRCLQLQGGELRFPPYIFRGALAERLIDKQVPEGALRDLPALAPLNATYRGNGAIAERYTYSYRFAECVIRRDSAGVRALLDTRLDSGREIDAIRNVSPAIGNCVPEGEQVKMDRVGMRMGFATVYFRLANALSKDASR